MTEDFRSRTGRQRRARTNARLFEAIFEVVDDGGIGSVSVDKVRNVAGLSRGSFYNYFDTLDAFLVKVSEAIGTIINEEQIELFRDEPSPTAQISGYLRYFVMRATSDLACAAILMQTLPFTGAVSEQMRERMLVTFARASETGEIDISSVPQAVEIGLGVLSAMLRWALRNGPDKDRIAEETTILLRGLGLPKAYASELAYRPLPALPKAPLRTAALSRGLEQPISFKK